MAEEHDDAQDGTLKAALRYVAITAALFAAIATAVEGLRFGAGVLVGGVIALVNLLVLARVVQAFLTKKGNTAAWSIIAVLKLFLLLGGVWLILKSGLVSGLALVIGYMSLPAGAVAASLFGPKPPDDAAK